MAKRPEPPAHSEGAHVTEQRRRQRQTIKQLETEVQELQRALRVEQARSTSRGGRTPK